MSRPIGSALRTLPRRIPVAARPAVRRGVSSAPAFAQSAGRTAWATGAAVGVAGLVGLATWNLRGDLVPTLLQVAHAEEAQKYIDPTTSTPFPSAIVNPNGKVLSLIGTGVRTVSFLAVRVYCGGIYIQEEALNKIKSGAMSGWEGYEPSRLLPPFKSTGNEVRGEELIARILDGNYAVAVTIVPLRNTSLTHLRDAFSRSLVARLKLAHVSSALTPEEMEAASTHLSELRTLFPGKQLDKGSSMVCHFFDGAVRFDLLDPKDPTKVETLGTLRDPVLARQLFLSYLSDTGSMYGSFSNSIETLTELAEQMYHGDEDTAKVWDNFADQKGLVEHLQYKSGNEPGAMGFGHLGLIVDDVPALVQRVQDAGYKIIKPQGVCTVETIGWPAGTPAPIQAYHDVYVNMSMIEGPDGYWIELVPRVLPQH
ncbi:hypothetical protein RQP46_006661 [Phenoliferia psychrophenolica]